MGLIRKTMSVSTAFRAPSGPEQTFPPAPSMKLTRQEKAANRASFDELTIAAAHGDQAALQALPGALAQTRASWRPRKLEAKLWDTFVAAARDVGSDDVLTLDEEARLAHLLQIFNLDYNGLIRHNPAAFEELLVCRINDGRVFEIDSPLILKRGEKAYGSFGVSLMKEVKVREFRGGSSGVSIPLGFGVRYRTGSVRGRSVVVGTELVAEDSGKLVVTSTRTVFLGQKKTLEFRHDKLVQAQQYTDGLQLSVSNRQAASMFKFNPGDSPTVAAALITHAVGAIMAG
jgi:hypothetical protein